MFDFFVYFKIEQFDLYKQATNKRNKRCEQKRFIVTLAFSMENYFSKNARLALSKVFV